MRCSENLASDVIHCLPTESGSHITKFPPLPVEKKPPEKASAVTVRAAEHASIPAAAGAHKKTAAELTSQSRRQTCAAASS